MKLAILFFVTLSFCGCISLSEHNSMQEEIDQLKAEIAQLGGKSVKVEKSHSTKLASSVNSLQQIDSEIDKLKGEIGALKVGVHSGSLPGENLGLELSVADRLQALERDMAQLKSKPIVDNKITSTKEESQEIESPASQNVEKTKNLKLSFLDIEKMYKNKKWKEVINGFEFALDKSKLSTVQKRKRAYYLGDSYYNKQEYEQAAVYLSEYVNISPRGKYISISKLHLGDCFRKLGDEGTAKIFYEEVVSSVPQAPIAKIARAHLKKM